MMKKLVYESLNGFERKKDALSSLGVGQRQLIKDWLDEMDVSSYIINDDLTIDVDFNVDFTDKGLVKFPDYVKFGTVGGCFNCYQNKFISLRGCPNYVGGYFSCRDNELTSLKGCPKYVGDKFFCSTNKI